MSEQGYEVVIAGAGPAGSTVANLLALAGHRVLMVEKDPFPRFHIGESLLPIDLPIFDRLAFAPDPARFVRKAGAEFFDEARGVHAVYHFSEGLRGTPGWAWQVERSVFDHALVMAAESRGAAVRYGSKVTEVRADEAGVTVALGDAAPLRCRYFVDATGQDAFLARRRRTVSPIAGFGIAGCFTHVQGISEEVERELHETGGGSIRVLILEEGWSWVIPLTGRKFSFGVVSRRQGIEPEIVFDVIERSPMLRRITAGATLVPPRVIRNFSFKNTTPFAPRIACVGDAACFLDPVFSSGVSLAMLSAERLADVLSPALREGREAEPLLTEPLHRAMRRAYDTFASLIQAFYSSNLVQHLFFAEDPDPRMRAGLISVLAGDVWREDNPFQNSLLSGRRLRSVIGEPPAPEATGS